ncbi:MAG TPA: TlpA disulfide reductase family protein [Draconibacterium sp.]|nr:TlpA disulfide reductase family protein [Draconibacterium sp.]HRX10541.1 TlpA disulfide reductase family protein [Draconibacterium sp.]
MKAFLFISFILIFTCNLKAQDEATLVKVGDKAPDFTIETENGKTKQLSDLKGKVVWINFFATWCPPCRQELPHLQKEVYNKLKNNPNFELIILGREHTWAEINKFKTDNKFNMPFYPDMGRKVFSLYAGQNIPRNFIIDKEGKIAVASIGFTEKEFEEIIEKVTALLK